MKKIILLIICFKIFKTEASTDTTQNGFGTYFNLNVEKITSTQIKLHAKIGFSYTRTMPSYLSVTSWPQNAHVVDTTTVPGVPICVIGKNINTGDTVVINFLPINGVYHTREFSDTNCYLPNLNTCQWCGLDDVLYSGVELSTEYTMNLPYSGTWKFTAMIKDMKVAMRDTLITNLDTMNYNPNNYLGLGNVKLPNTVTVLGNCIINTTKDSSGFTMTSSDWNYAHNGIPNVFNLGIVREKASDILMITHVPTLTSAFSMIPVANPTNLYYLYDSVKNLNFRGSYTLQHPMDCDTFSFNPATQEVYFKTKFGQDQQVILLTFKVDIWRAGQIISTTYISKLFVVKESKNIPNAVSSVSDENRLTVYPNPTTGYIQIDGLEKTEVVTVYNMTGHLMVKSFSNSIDMSAWPNGIYFIKIGNYTVKRVIKN